MLNKLNNSLAIADHHDTTSDRTYELKAMSEAKAALSAMVAEIIGDSPENPYGKRDAFLHEWGAQAALYDKHVRDGQRQHAAKMGFKL